MLFIRVKVDERVKKSNNPGYVPDLFQAGTCGRGLEMITFCLLFSWADET